MEVCLSTNGIKCNGEVLSSNRSVWGEIPNPCWMLPSDGPTSRRGTSECMGDNPSNFFKSDPLQSESTKVLVGEKDVGNYADLNQLHKQ